jgi:hypothetical protein
MRIGRLAFAIVVTVLLGGILAVASGPLAALPAMLAFLPLLADRYVGTAQLERLIERRRRPRPALRIAASCTRAVERVALPRGSRLIACSLAKRPPPVLSLGF